MIRSYSKPLAPTHAWVRDAMSSGTIYVSEKIDGSQFSMALIEGVLCCRSRGQQIDIANPGMFAPAVRTAWRLGDALVEGWTYRCEFLAKTKHNTLHYDRVPRGHLVLYDIDRGECDYVPGPLAGFGDEFEIDAVEVIETAAADLVAVVAHQMALPSLLGGKREGVVAKRYDVLTPDGKVAMAKYVSGEFVEIHQKRWRAEEARPAKRDVVDEIGEAIRTEARWHKVVQHMREAGALMDAPQDIGPLLRELAADVEGDAADIGEMLWARYRKELLKHAGRGFADWYRAQLNRAARTTSADPAEVARSEDPQGVRPGGSMTLPCGS